jgi:hypothetical protein
MLLKKIGILLFLNILVFSGLSATKPKDIERPIDGLIKDEDGILNYYDLNEIN